MKRIIYGLAVLFLVSCSGASNQTQSRDEARVSPASAPLSVRLYEGPELSGDKIVRIVSEQVESRYMYFISVNGSKIPNRSLINGPREVLLKPGNHSVQMRFVAKGKIAIPLRPFPEIDFKEGTTYVVKSEFQEGTGSYIQAAQTTKITAWIEEAGLPDKLGLMTLNGFGR